jgi:ABC-type nickel/cobalt efflux system permease component RcnA
VLLFANSLGLYVAGIGATFAMSLGTFITVSTIAVLTVLFKNAATSWIGPESVWAARVFRGLAITGALAILVLGLILLTGSLTADRPLI